MTTPKLSFIQRVVLYGCMIALALYIFAPLYWLFISSISKRSELLNVPPHWIPDEPTFDNYRNILFPDAETSRNFRDFRQALGNSVIVSGSVAFISVVLGSLAAYAFARLNFRRRRTGLLLFVGLRMLPAISVVIPLYVLLRGAQLLNTHLALILVYLSFTLPFTIYSITSFLQSIPPDLEDAARVDGCSRIGAFWYIILPISRPGLVASLVFAFLLAWDEFFFALLLTSTPAAKTIPVAIAEFTGRNAIDFTAQATGGILATIPPVVLALMFQRYIVHGLTSGAVKG